MDGSESRQVARDSLFVMAEMRIDGSGNVYRIKVRNLSAGGMMGEGSVRVSSDATVWVNVRHSDWIEGTVAWVHENRFGVAFREEIDPGFVRTPVAADSGSPPVNFPKPRKPATGAAVRKI